MNGWLTSGKITTASAGGLALIANDSEAINMGSYGSLSLGGSGNVTFSGTLTPSGSTYNLGGGGGTLTFTPTITGDASLNVSGPAAVVLTSVELQRIDHDQRRHPAIGQRRAPAARIDQQHQRRRR